MEVRYSINVVDVFYGQLHFFLRSRTGRLLGIALVVFTIAMTAPTLLSYDNIFQVVAYIIVVCGPGLGIMILFLAIASTAIYIGNKKIYQDMSVQLSDAGIVHTMRGIRSEYAWASLERISATRRLIVLSIADAAALAIPRRAFTTEAEATQFLELASAKMSRKR
jgi:hypothetical protein